MIKMKNVLSRHTDNGFTLIEVLIAMLFLTMATLTVNAAFKQFVGYQDKMSHYEKIYTTVLTLRDQLSLAPLVPGQERGGILNDLEYQYTVKQIDQRDRFKTGLDSEQENTVGGSGLSLFKIILVADGHTFEFLQTRSQRR